MRPTMQQLILNPRNYYSAYRVVKQYKKIIVYSYGLYYHPVVTSYYILKNYLDNE